MLHFELQNIIAKETILKTRRGEKILTERDERPHASQQEIDIHEKSMRRCLLEDFSVEVHAGLRGQKKIKNYSRICGKIGIYKRE